MQAAVESALLTETERAVMSVIHAQGETTRPEIGRALDLTKPTVSTAVAQLERHGLVAAVSARQGTLGRAAAVYGIAQSAGWLLGIDIGSTRVKLLARGLDGAPLASATRELDEPHQVQRPNLLPAVQAEVAQVMKKLSASYGPLRAVGIALPRIIPEYLAQSSSGNSGRGHQLPEMLDALSLPTGIPVLLENNVNCAALAELDRGVAAGHEDFVFLQVGVGIGSGIVADRKVLRGARGGAGEVSSLPTSWPARPRDDEFALEHYLGSRQLLARCTASWDKASGEAPDTVPTLFAYAQQGVPAAVSALAQHAQDIGQLALALTAVVDPALIVLGGGVGQNPLLTEGIREAVQRSKPYVEVSVSALGDEATVEGAVALTLDHALWSLLGSHHPRRLDGRTTVLTTGQPLND